MAGQTEEKGSESSRLKRVVRPVIPALPLRPVKRRPASRKVQDVVPVDDEPQRGTSMPLLSGGCGTSDRALEIQFGETKGDERPAAYSPASFANTSSSVDVTFSSVPSGMFKLGQLAVSKAEKSLPDASNNDYTLTQGISSRTSSAPPTLNTFSDSSPPNSKTNASHICCSATCTSQHISHCFSSDLLPLSGRNRLHQHRIHS